MFTEQRYEQYISDFNSTFRPGGMSISDFFDSYYEPDATFDILPQARKNVGRDEVLAFWGTVSGNMQEVILNHTTSRTRRRWLPRRRSTSSARRTWSGTAFPTKRAAGSG